MRKVLKVNMRFLYIFPFFLLAWTMAIFAYQSYTDGSYAGLFFYLIFVGLFCYIAVRKYKTVKQNLYATMHLIAINVGLLPLLYSNLFLSPIVMQGEEINESGMVFVLVLIYSPIMYVGTLLPLMAYAFWKKKRNE